MGVRSAPSDNQIPPSLSAGLLDQHYMLVPRDGRAPLRSLSSVPDLALDQPTLSSLRAPPRNVLRALTHLPTASMPGRSRNGKGNRGKIVARVFNQQAGRPLPALTSPLTEFRATMTTTSNFTTSMTVPVFYTQYVTLAQFSAATAYTGLFDEYKIEMIEVWIEPTTVLSSSVSATNYASAVDLDDANTPANYGDVSDRQMAIVSEAGTAHYHRWRPYVATALYSGAFTSYGSIPSPWIDCASPSVQHFGIKAATFSQDGLARVINVTTRALFSFRGPAI